MRKRLLPAAVFFLATAIGLSLAGQLWMSSEDADRLRFGQLADDAMERVEARLQLHLALLDAARAFMTVEGIDVPRETYRTFLAGLDLADRYNGIQGIGFARVVPTTAVEPARSDLTERYGDEIGIWPETDQPIRTPIVLLEPQDERNRAALGYDMYADETRREAMEKAARVGDAQASGAVRLVQEIDENRQFGFLIYLPMVGAEEEPAAAAADIPGFVYAPFRVGDLLNAVLLEEPILPVRVEVFDGAASPENLIYASAENEGARVEKQLSTDRKLDVLGREWTVRLTPTPEFRRIGSNYPAALLAAVVLMLALVLALLALVQARRVEAVAALNREGERNLAQKDLMLREMNHRIKNSIARMLSIARQTARRAENLDEFVERYSARLQAMASAQEMLTRSTWGRARVDELLSGELAQVFGEDREDYMIFGPEVEVDETKAQALGLTFHELATNAMKYGALSETNGSLVVEWKPQDTDLEIVWSETGGIETDPTMARPGFGTKLIDATIRGELSGTIERSMVGEAFVIVIRFPLGASAERVDRAQRKA
ncbi:CHASE domain-containing protein [Jiella marina]|uniref:CHASE domain-containing protein n=1 Tax=Jiella sp. LLJ827 TaxID=2917712 RepID=UPI0021012151|nr:CHASE domain-containing protein [Jiella sp. LLJ827]MCQ0989569.1 CHASE domain-containing protein [Jiella sp. LLJ827]